MLLTPKATRVTLAELPPGAAGTRATLKVMARLSRIGGLSTIIRETALPLIQKLRPKDWRSEASSLLSFVQRDIRYVRDPEDAETVQTPEKTLELRAGDCDDKSVLLAALMKSIAHPVRFVAGGFAPGLFSHVWVETRIADRWVPMETTEMWSLGKGPTFPYRMVQDI